MTTNLKTTEILDAVISLINGASMGFTPAIVMEGTLEYWVEAEDISSDLPAILVTISSLDLTNEYVTGEYVTQAGLIRILLIDEWALGANVRDIQQQRAEALAQVFVGSTGDAFNLGASIAGLQYLLAMPTRLEFEPPESQLLRGQEDRRMFAVAVNLQVETQSARV